jgi:PAS domain S-box-containing protein
MKVYRHKGVLYFFLLALIVLLGLGVFSYISTQRLIETTRMLSHSSRVIAKSEEILKAIVDVETSVRGYVITNDSAYLEPYWDANTILPAKRLELDSMMRTNARHADQQDELKQLNGLVERRLALAETRIVAANQQFELARALIVQGDGKRLMDSIRIVVKTIQNKERTFLRANTGISSGYLRQLQLSTLGFVVVVIAVVVILFFLINKQMRVRDRVETELRKASSEIRDLYDKAPCGYLSVGPDIFLVNINQTLLGWLGYSFEEVVAKLKFEDLLSPASRQKFIAGFESDFEQYKKQGYVNNLEFEFLRKDKSTFPVMVNSVATFDDVGNFIKSRSTVFDNSERVNALSRFESLIESLPDALIMVDNQGVMTLANAQCENFFGYSRNELIGQPVDMLIPHEVRGSHTGRLQEYFTNPTTRPMGAGLELSGLRKDGTQFPVEISLGPIRTKNTLIGSAVIRDITERKKLDERLVYLARYVDNTMEAVYATTPDFVIKRWNKGAENQYGFSSKEVLGQSVFEVLVSGTPESIRDGNLIQLRQTGQWKGEMEYFKKDGSAIIALESVTAVLNSRGEVDGYISISHNVTDRKRAEKEITYLANLLESTREAVYSVTSDFKIRSWNKGAENLYGYTPAEALGKPVLDVIKSRMDEAKRLDIREHLISHGHWEGELEHFRRDESIIYILSSATAIRNAEGKIDGFVSVAQDITDRKTSERQLHESEEKFNKAFQASPAGIIVTRLSDSKIIEVNESFCRMLKITKEELIGHSAEEAGILIDIKKREHVYALLEKEGQATNIEMELKNRSGAVITVLFSVQLLILKTEAHALTVIYDISRLKEAERQINKLNQELEAFSYSVSHDLRAPLRSIGGYARILEEDYAPNLDAEGKKTIATITRNATRMGRLIDDMLNLSRLSRIEVDQAQVNMLDVVTKIISELTEFENHKVNIQVLNILPAYADLDMIRQVWVNLISNAIKYSSKKSNPEIEVGSYQQGKEVCYYVKDNGDGFDPQYAHKLFGVFQRLHKQQDFDGTGVGLAICKRIIERHHGRVWAEGKPNQGAIFYFSLSN